MQPRVLGDDSATLTGVVNGRPPDQGVLISVPTKLERMAHPVSDEDRQVVKRSRGEGDDIMDVREDGIMGLDQGSALVVAATDNGCGKGTESVKDGDEPIKPSSKDMLTGRRPEDADVRATPSVPTKVDPMEKYGPWMMASGRKLEADVDGAEGMVDPPTLSASGPVINALLLETDGQQRSVILNDDLLVAGERVKGEKQSLLQGSSSIGMDSIAHEQVSVGASKVVSSEMVVPVRVSLDPKSHVAVRVVDTDKDLVSLPRSGRRAFSGVGLSQLKPAIRFPTGKGGEKKGNHGRLKASGCGSSKLRLGEWIDGLDAALVVNGQDKSSSAILEDGLNKEAVSTVQWHKNTAFSTKSGH
ncbi:hypothetical protein V6N11_032636 [Hibiscus sabdariffa]|uniref:Uncharacterized protein n=1 Tax=Hibiscus sabdariffa TaxID=183260 RepID=A0ABR2T1S6_9ROSI